LHYIIFTYLIYPALYLICAMRRGLETKRILIIQNAKIGDLICATPIFRDIRIKYPKAHIVALVNPAAKGVVENNPHIDSIETIKEGEHQGLFGKLRLAALIRKGNYDIAICLNPNVALSVTTFWGLVPTRLSVLPYQSGFTYKLASGLFTKVERLRPGEMVVDSFYRMLEAIGVKPSSPRREVFATESAEALADRLLMRRVGPFWGIAVSAGNKLKELGVEKIANLCAMLLRVMEGSIILIGSEEDASSAKAVMERVHDNWRIIDTTGKIRLKELPALIKRLSLFIGVDTGITYMADALLTPILYLPGPSDTSGQRPVAARCCTVKRDVSCAPCTHVFRTVNYCRTGTFSCIKGLEPMEIVSRMGGLLKKG
jgi:heptosyltransferase-2